MRNRGKWLDYEKTPVMPTYHPAFLLRQTGKELVESKWQVYYDLKSAVEKAQKARPGYILKSESIPDLLQTYNYLKKERHM